MVGERRRNGQNAPQSNVFQHGRAEDEACEPGLKNAQFLKDARNDGYRRYGRGAGENQHGGAFDAFVADEAVHRNPRPETEKQYEEKRQRSADAQKPERFAAILLRE